MPKPANTPFGSAIAKSLRSCANHRKVSLYAKDFYITAEDNCASGVRLQTGVMKSYERPVANVNQYPGITFKCSDIDSGAMTVHVWVEDAGKNRDYCASKVRILDNPIGVCKEVQRLTVAGQLVTEQGIGIEDAALDLQAAHPDFLPISLALRNEPGGSYKFLKALPIGADYTVTPLKDDNPLNGVNTFDIVLISKHILGIESLGSPYKMIAADVNNSNGITAADMVEIRKLILGIYTNFPNSNSWRFVDKSYVFPDPANPFDPRYPENISKTGVLSDQLHDDFIGVKIGDVNGTRRIAVC
jgi:hypothetical protein